MKNRENKENESSGCNPLGPFLNFKGLFWLFLLNNYAIFWPEIDSTHLKTPEKSHRTSEGATPFYLCTRNLQKISINFSASTRAKLVYFGELFSNVSLAKMSH